MTKSDCMEQQEQLKLIDKTKRELRIIRISGQEQTEGKG